MRLIKCECGTRYVNPAHVVSVFIEEAYKNGKPISGFQVVANMTFGGGNEILFWGTLEECRAFIGATWEV